MKNKVLTALFSIGTLLAVAQSDSSYTKTDSILVKQDTIKVGNFFIVKKGNEYSNPNSATVQIGNVTINANDLDGKPVIKIERKKPAPKKVSTNWWIFDLGFAGNRDQTNYATAVGNTSYLRTVRAANGAPNKQTFNLAELPLKRLELDPTVEGQNLFEFVLPHTKKKVLFKFTTGRDEEELSVLQEKQKKLEEEALKKYEEEKKIEELKRIEEEKKNPAGAAKGKAPPAPAKKVAIFIVIILNPQ
jgi:hypothetical protein